MSHKIASFAAGCFWGVEARFRETEGVVDAAVGYMGGYVGQPDYRQVCSGSTGHAEAVQLVFDEQQLSYGELLDVFFSMHNPTTSNRQGPDVGSQYRSVIFWHDEGQRAEAEAKIGEVNASGAWKDPVVTEVVQAGQFWRAEEYHQRYFEKNGTGYCHV
jgi:peptide-methionine (S)-S-oxide reductase